MLTIGADPEVFVQNNNNFISAHGLVPGTKRQPYPVKNGAVQVDGMALEFNIDPASSEDGFIFNLNSVLAQLRAMVPDLKVVPEAIAFFSDEILQSSPREALDMGCDPDFDAWAMQVNPKPNGAVPFRTAAGHVHLGWTEGKSGSRWAREVAPIARQLDYYLGLPSLLIDREDRRRELYGRAGAYRPKPYGMEYRVLSNFWLKSEGLMRWVFRNTQLAFASMGSPLEDMFESADSVINSGDRYAALDIITEAGIPMPDQGDLQ